MFSPNSTGSASPESSVSSLFYSSDLSGVSSRTDITYSTDLRHLLVISPNCETPAVLAKYLQALPISKECTTTSRSYLLLAVRFADANLDIKSESKMSDAFRTLGEALGNALMFNAWELNKLTRYYESSGTSIDDTLGDLEQQITQPTKLAHIDMLNVFASSNLHVLCHTPITNCGKLYLLEHVPFRFPPLRPLSPNASKVKPFGPPTREDWTELWKAWDLVTLGMIPPEMLHQKPIDLRHKCLFYIGHIPTFLNILLSRLLKEPYTEPKSYTQIFERGIDPHVDDPAYCHSHSEVPEADEDWPVLTDVLAYRDRIRVRLLQLYDDIESGKWKLNRSLARVLQMTLEHEEWHIETLLYMLIQRVGSGTLPPPGFTTPPWTLLAEEWSRTPAPSSPTVTLGPAALVLGHDDSEADDSVPGLEDDVLGHEFGWDNESPGREIPVAKFRIDWRPVTNGQFLVFWEHEERKGDLPASWVEKNGEIMVLTVYGPVPMSVAEHWPMLSSYDQLQSYAQWKGGRIPTEVELRLFFDMYEVGFEGGANVGFRNWHPIPATAGCSDDGRGSNGGVWEWTSTVFDTHPGLVPTKHFPGYSTDFFDGKHQVVLGASYATVPRLAGRRTVRNFYQHNYPYAWVGARVAYDA
ncbi:hypothetical protein ACEPAG_7621 [Sanghuangporus baumii]